jgi:ketosteroid isomerase-like protein
MKGEASFTQQLDGLSKQFVEKYKRGDAKACSEAYTEDAIKILGGGLVIRGRTGIAADLQRSLDSHHQIAGFTIVC